MFEATRSTFAQSTVHYCTKVILDSDYSHIFVAIEYLHICLNLRNLNAIHMEFIEIKKALEMTIGPTDKFRNDLMEMNQKLYEQIWSQTKHSTNSVIKSMNTNHALWSTANDNDVLDFQIGNSVSSLKATFGNNIFCFGEGDNTKSLIDDNENLRIG